MQRNHRQHPNLAKHWPGSGPWCELELSPGTVGFFLRPGHSCEAAGGITTSPSPVGGSPVSLCPLVMSSFCLTTGVPPLMKGYCPRCH